MERWVEEHVGEGTTLTRSMIGFEQRANVEADHSRDPGTESGHIFGSSSGVLAAELGAAVARMARFVLFEMGAALRAYL